MEMDAHRFCVAPMMDYTDKHYRFFLRLLSKYSFLYTEMISADAIIHGDRNNLLEYNSMEQPLALQIGGSDIEKVIEASILGEEFGYNEINLNVGCPSPRVQKGKFGASLMSDPQLVASIIKKVKLKINIPFSVKCRIGIDDQDVNEDFPLFIKYITDAGVDLIIVHARKALLNGISPKENRVIPELNYEVVYKAKKYLQNTRVILNGGINSFEEILDHLEEVDGVMLGRKIIDDPLFLSQVDKKIFKKELVSFDIKDVIGIYSDYVSQQALAGVSISKLIKPLFGIYNNQPFGKLWRRSLNDYRANNRGLISSILELHSMHKQKNF